MLSINQLARLANALVCAMSDGTERGQATTLLRMELGLQAGSWVVREPETLEGLFQMMQRRKTGSVQSPGGEEKADGVLAGPRAGAQLCPLYLLGGGPYALSSSSSFGHKAFPRESLRGC